MIVFAAIVPHSPLLIPSIGKTHREKLTASLAAYQHIEHALYLSKPDSICIIAPHGTRYPEAFSMNLAARYHGTLKEFGDFSTTVAAKSDYLLIDRLQRHLRTEDIPFTLTSNEELDYSFTIPLLLLTSHLTHTWKLIPISPSNLDGQSHYEFGHQLKQVLHAEQHRIAVIASADLSHALSETSPGGSSLHGPRFDELMRSALGTHDIQALLSLPSDTIEKSAQCGYRPIMTLLGALQDLNVKPHILSYEQPFGVGYINVQYQLA